MAGDFIDALFAKSHNSPRLGQPDNMIGKRHGLHMGLSRLWWCDGEALNFKLEFQGRSSWWVGSEVKQLFNNNSTFVWPDNERPMFTLTAYLAHLNQNNPAVRGMQ